jgi:hypothetical protein
MGQYKKPAGIMEKINDVMAPEYRELWNDQIQQKIDQDIEANRKADACIVLDNV